MSTLIGVGGAVTRGVGVEEGTAGVVVGTTRGGTASEVDDDGAQGRTGAGRGGGGAEGEEEGPEDLLDFFFLGWQTQ